MRENLLERIRILRGAEMITASVADFCEEAVDYLLTIKPDADEERFGMLITHLAMGTQRLITCQEEMPVSQDVLAAVKKEPQFAAAVELADRIIAMSEVAFSETESDFLKIHLCNLIS